MSQAAEILSQPTMVGLSVSRRTILIDETTGQPLSVIHPGPPEPIAAVPMWDKSGFRIVVNRNEVGEWTAKGFSADKPKALLEAEARSAADAAEEAAIEAQVRAETLERFNEAKAARADKANGKKG